MADPQPGVDLSGLHRELDSLKSRLCRCQHQGNCLSCKGFEVVRQQAQAVAAAASQPVLMQVAQEAAMRDLFSQLGGLQDKLTGDPQLSDLLSRFAERVQEDLGGPEELENLLRSLGFAGPAAPGSPSRGTTSFDDRPSPGSDKPAPPDEGLWPRDRQLPREDPPGRAGRPPRRSARTRAAARRRTGGRHSRLSGEGHPPSRSRPGPRRVRQTPPPACAPAQRRSANRPRATHPG